jgi:hypothetical protein
MVAALVMGLVVSFVVMTFMVVDGRRGGDRNGQQAGAEHESCEHLFHHRFLERERWS